MVESCGVCGTWDRLARSGRVGFVFARGAGSVMDVRDLRPTRGWLAEPIASVGARGIGSVRLERRHFYLRCRIIKMFKAERRDYCTLKGSSNQLCLGKEKRKLMTWCGEGGEIASM
jgi:hypothetical protein